VATEKQSASHLDLSVRRFQMLKKAGVFDATPGRARRNLDEDRVAYIRHLRRNSSGTASVYSDERTRLIKAQADRAELELQLRSEELVELSDVIDANGRMIVAARNRLRGMPNKIAAIVVTMTPGEAQTLMLTEVDAALNEIADGIQKLAGNDDPRIAQ